MASLWDEADAATIEEIHKNRYLEQPKTGLQLISRLISKGDRAEEISMPLKELNKFINYDFVDLCKLESIPNETELFKKIDKALMDLEDTAEFPALANKNVVAVAGGFSAGKSRFINSLLREELLPTDPRPTTVIPTYIVSAKDDESLYALNTFKNKVSLDREAISAISHEFNRAYGIGFSHIVDVMMMESPAFNYVNIALLDTPGYSNSDSLERGDNTDEKKALEHLRHVDHLIWVLDINKGTLPESDIAFLKQLSLSSAKPIFLILNKADLKIKSDIENIMKVVRDRLNQASIPCAGVVAYSSQIDPHEILGDSLIDYLSSVNSKQKYARLSRGFDQVFDEITTYIRKETERRLSIIKSLNITIIKGDGNLPEEDLQTLKDSAKTLRKGTESTQSLIQKFSKLRHQMDEKINAVLSYISVDDERKKDETSGIYSEIITRDQNLLVDLDSDRKKEGTVVRSDAFGVYIDIGSSEKIMLHKSEIHKTYSNHIKDIFPLGGQCTVKINSVDYFKGVIKMIVTPKGDES
ncbi:dynamin family protein [Dethiosulfovibrio salsuginis]|uniref:S1 RNA binding domain-containing protein n=1 Tax=Dethiosulfovibrio salsuginis TaxID=561720 RepID=A0A1X7L9W7_9BACT|nr:dynamin family protein [Dethiosulfovibrio salsuginis]SMG50274.1 S1 RNA binding domain-containing protein [Dethiosulfovibrio salsuginis]